MANPLTQTQLLEVIDRQFPDSYLDPIRNVGPGWEMYQGFAKVGERCSLAVSRAEDDGYILTAKGPKQATVAATFYRENAGAGAGTVLAGTIVKCSGGGQMFRTLAPAVFSGAALEVTVDAIAIGYGYEWNIKGKYTAPNGETAPGELDTVVLPLQDPPYWDPSIRVRNDTDADGLGRPGTLDALGDERGLPRQPNESDENYRARVRLLPDTITPAAFRRQLTQFFKPYGIDWWALETWQLSYQVCYDAPEVTTNALEDFDARVFTYDDPREHVPISNRWLDENDVEGAFIVELEPTAAIREYGMAYDDPETHIVTAAGRRAISAFDLSDVLPGDLFGGAYDAEDIGFDEMIVALAQLLESIKGHGIKATIHIAGDD